MPEHAADYRWCVVCRDRPRARGYLTCGLESCVNANLSREVDWAAKTFIGCISCLSFAAGSGITWFVWWLSS